MIKLLIGLSILFNLSLFGDSLEDDATIFQREFTFNIDSNTINDSIMYALKKEQWQFNKENNTQEFVIKKMYVSNKHMFQKGGIKYNRVNIYIKITYSKDGYKILHFKDNSLNNKELSLKEKRIVFDLIEKIEYKLANLTL